MSQMFLQCSTVLLWSCVAASFLYSLRTFPAPFYASLTEEQRAIKQASAQVRRKFFWCAFLASLIVVSILVFRFT